MVFELVPDLTKCEDRSDQGLEIHRADRRLTMLEGKPDMNSGSQDAFDQLNLLREQGSEMFSEEYLGKSLGKDLFTFFQTMLLDTTLMREEIYQLKWLNNEVMRELRDYELSHRGFGSVRPNEKVPDWVEPLTLDQQTQPMGKVNIRAHPGADSDLEAAARKQRDGVKARFCHHWKDNEQTFNSLPTDVKV